jgi:hypothetical protein
VKLIAYFHQVSRLRIRGSIPPLLQYVFMVSCSVEHGQLYILRGTFEKFVDWRQYTAFMQREAVTVTPSCSGGGNVVVA